MITISHLISFYLFKNNHLIFIYLLKEGKRRSMLGKLIDRCGTDSLIPLAMAQDALFAGMDTTGNAAAFLLYLVASNPDKQELLHKEIIEKVPIGKNII
jgi:hypothetical protein